MAPVVEQVAAEFQGKIRVFGVDLDKAPDTPARFGIMSIPTLLFFKQGKESARIVGAVPKRKIVETLNALK